MAKVSAIITAYNVDGYIATAVQSVIDAGIGDLEIIAVDDGSTDFTRPILAALADRLAGRVAIRNIFLSRNTIGGVATAANIGLDQARGEIVLFVDGDDWVIPRNLGRAVAMLAAGRDDFLVTDCAEYWNGSGEYSKYPEAAQWEALKGARDLEARRRILLAMAPFPWRKIYRRAFLDDLAIRFPVGDFMFEDNPFHWETTVRARRFGFLRAETHVHRMARPGQTVAARGPKFIRIFDHYDTIRRMLEANGRYQASEAALVGWLLKHVIWAAEHVPPGYLNEVYEKAGQRLRQLGPDAFWHGVAVSGYDARNVRRLAAIYLGERFEFLREF